MKIQDVKRQFKQRGRPKMIAIKIDTNISEWLTKNDISPTLIFYKALEELGYKMGCTQCNQKKIGKK